MDLHFSALYPFRNTMDVESPSGSYDILHDGQSGITTRCFVAVSSHGRISSPGERHWSERHVIATATLKRLRIDDNYVVLLYGRFRRQIAEWIQQMRYKQMHELRGHHVIYAEPLHGGRDKSIKAVLFQFGWLSLQIVCQSI